jgi:small subunit ribosomal protein S20
MPKHKSAFKRMRQERKRYLVNKSIKSALKTVIKKTLLEENEEKKAALLREAVSKIDKAAKKGVLHKNAAARKKSRLMKKILAS